MNRTLLSLLSMLLIPALALTAEQPASRQAIVEHIKKMEVEQACART